MRWREVCYGGDGSGGGDGGGGGGGGQGPDGRRRLHGGFAAVLQRVFLPVGYPETVRPEYLEYQLYDSLQGICSYVRGVLCAKAVFQGAGVGDAAATPLAAGLSWALKDGLAMLGTLAFAYKFGDVFENNVKEWRLAADVFNNVALTLDLLTGYYPKHFLLLQAASSLFKAFCGLVAGATKARIATHFARDGHLADVISKESSQETAVSLLGLLIGMALSPFVSSDERTLWAVFLGLLGLHQWANWRLVKVLVLDTITASTLHLLVSSKLEGAPSPMELTKRERLWLPIHLAIFGPKIGASLADLETFAPPDTSISKYCVYGVEKTSGRFLVCFSKSVDECDDDVVKVTAALIGYFAHKTFTADVAARGKLLNKRVVAELPRLVALANSLHSAGWDTARGKSRLGEGPFRYIAPPHVSSKEE